MQKINLRVVSMNNKLIKLAVVVVFVATAFGDEPATYYLERLNGIMKDKSDLALNRLTAAKEVIPFILSGTLSERATILLDRKDEKELKLGLRHAEKDEKFQELPIQEYITGVLRTAAKTIKESFKVVKNFSTGNPSIDQDTKELVLFEYGFLQTYKDAGILLDHAIYKGLFKVRAPDHAYAEHQAVAVIELYNAFGYGKEHLNFQAKYSGDFNVFKYIADDSELFGEIEKDNDEFDLPISLNSGTNEELKKLEKIVRNISQSIDRVETVGDLISLTENDIASLEEFYRARNKRADEILESISNQIQNFSSSKNLKMTPQQIQDKEIEFNSKQVEISMDKAIKLKPPIDVIKDLRANWLKKLKRMQQARLREMQEALNVALEEERKREAAEVEAAKEAERKRLEAEEAERKRLEAEAAEQARINREEELKKKNEELEKLKADAEKVRHNNRTEYVRIQLKIKHLNQDIKN